MQKPYFLRLLHQHFGMIVGQLINKLQSLVWLPKNKELIFHKRSIACLTMSVLLIILDLPDFWHAAPWLITPLLKQYALMKAYRVKKEATKEASHEWVNLGLLYMNHGKKHLYNEPMSTMLRKIDEIGNYQLTLNEKAMWFSISACTVS